MDVSADTRAQFRRVREVLQERLANARRAPRVTWVADEAAHVTLRFIGEVSEAAGAEVQTVLTAPFEISAVDTQWTELGTFPGGRRPRVIWLGASSSHEALAALASAVNTRLEPIVGPGEERKFRGHLTIGRIRNADVKFNWPRVLEGLEPGASHTLVDHVTLYQSRLSPKGPTYTPLCAVPLRTR